MMRSEAKFEITGWLAGEPRFATRQGNGGEFLTGSMTISVSKRAREGSNKVEYRKYFVDISGKGVERLKKDVEAGLWIAGDIVTVKGELVPGPVTQDPETGKNKYGRTYFRCWEYTNWDEYSRSRAERRKTKGLNPDNKDTFNKEDYKDFKFGDKDNQSEGAVL